MLKWFKSKKKKLKQDEDDGYNYAAGELLRGEPPREVYSDVECAYEFGDYSPFDTGIEQALRDWEKKTGEKII